MSSLISQSPKPVSKSSGLLNTASLVESEAIELAMGAAASFEYEHGKEIAQKVVQGTLSDTTARTTLKAPKSLIDDLALKSGFINGYGEGGEAMYYALIR